MKGQSRDRADSLLEKALVIANDAKLVAIEIVEMNLLKISTGQNRRNAVKRKGRKLTLDLFAIEH